jgi:CysZ protein
MFASLGKTIANFFDGTLRGVAMRSVLLTLFLFFLAAVGAEFGLQQLPTLGSHWVNVALETLAPILVLFLLVILGAPVAALFASLYLDRVATRVEAKAYPSDPPALNQSAVSGLGAGIRFVGLIILANAALLPVDIELPGISELLTLIVNGWLLGREYFELAALRHMSRASAAALRSKHGGKLFAAGLLIATMTVLPFVDLLAPLFGTVLMVHMFKRLSAEKAST